MNKSKTDDISAWLARRAQELTIDIEDARTMGKGTEIYCDDPDCRGLIRWDKCPACGYEAWWHQQDVCVECDYAGPVFD